jgi:hypothetical protein
MSLHPDPTDATTIAAAASGATMEKLALTGGGTVSPDAQGNNVFVAALPSKKRRSLCRNCAICPACHRRR